MQRIPMREGNATSGPAREILREARDSFGSVPNLMSAMANSPALLRGHLDLGCALEQGPLTPVVRELIAIVVAQKNECGYCLSAHAYAAQRLAEMSPEEITAARPGDHMATQTRAVLQFPAAVKVHRGGVSDEALASARAAGMSDAEITEVIGHVAANVLTNYLAKVAHVPVDSPIVTLDEPSAQRSPP